MALPIAPKDSLGRRMRAAIRQPRKERILIKPDDLIIFDALDEFDYVPTSYLKLLFPNRNENALTDRLTALFHGSMVNGAFIDKPDGQWKSFFADIQHIVYTLCDKAQALVDEKKEWIPARRVDNHFVHQLMNGCVGFSLKYLLANKYIHRHAVLAKKQSKLELPLLSNERRALVPDDLFGIDYGGEYRFFAVEIDRATESITRTASENKQPPTLEKKFQAYLDVMQMPPKGVPFPYKEVWGIPNLMVLIVTTDQAQKKRMMSKLLKMDARLASRFLFKVQPVFGGVMWRVPETILDVLTPWERADGSTFDITTP